MARMNFRKIGMEQNKWYRNDGMSLPIMDD